MATCEAELRALVKSIEPTPTQRNGAVRSHNNLREVLNTGHMEKRIVTSYLSGSYARNTVIYPLDDVDIIVVIDPKAWGGGWLDPNPEAVLKSFHRAIKYRYPNSHVRMQRRSVGLQLYHLDIDVVPAIDGGNDKIRIADRQEDKWILSAPKRHATISSQVNDLRGGRFKPLVKLLKYWNGQLPRTARFKSFAIETIATRVFQHVHFDTIQEGLLFFFDFLSHHGREETVYEWNEDYGVSFSRLWGVTIPDTAGTGSNVGASVDRTRTYKFLVHAVRTRNKRVFRRICG